jgi:protoporphyrinogen oxidase
LAFTTAVVFNIGLDRAELSAAAATHFYDEDVVFSRINLPHMFSPSNAPRGCGAIQAEVYFPDKYKAMNANPSSLMETVVRDLTRCGFISEQYKILFADTVINRYANVIYDFDRVVALSTIRQFLREMKIEYCGRYGEWNHAWTDGALIGGGEGCDNCLREAGRPTNSSSHSSL